MTGNRQIYGQVKNKTGMKRIFGDIRHDIDSAGSRPASTELYKRAGYLITLMHAPSWQSACHGSPRDHPTLRADCRIAAASEQRRISHKTETVAGGLPACAPARPITVAGRNSVMDVAHSRSAAERLAGKAQDQRQRP